MPRFLQQYIPAVSYPSALRQAFSLTLLLAVNLLNLECHHLSFLFLSSFFSSLLAFPDLRTPLFLQQHFLALFSPLARKQIPAQESPLIYLSATNVHLLQVSLSCHQNHVNVSE
jgi:hypothetical protein